MNNTLILTGRFQSAPKEPRPVKVSIGKNRILEAGKIRKLADDLEKAIETWGQYKTDLPPYIEVEYGRIVPKSRRMQGIIPDGKAGMVGARYAETGNTRHIFTYRVEKAELRSGLGRLRRAAGVALRAPFGGRVTDRDVEELGRKAADIDNRLRKAVEQGGFRPKQFQLIASDCDIITAIRVPSPPETEADSVMVTLFDTGEDIGDTLARLGVSYVARDGNTVVVTKEEYALLRSKAPFIMAMSCDDSIEWLRRTRKRVPLPMGPEIPKPAGEPVVGVIDSSFDTGAYFSDWVESHDMLPAFTGENQRDYAHATEVCSIIVDGPAVTGIQDNCGRFRVKHFAVLTAQGQSAMGAMKSIREIVRGNPDIKVWNLSLGSKTPVPRNFVSYQASVLDELQEELGVIFVIAAGNSAFRDYSHPVVGSPADSLNAMTVGSVKASGESASYSKRGPVLRSYVKPDVCDLGGDETEPLKVWSKSGPKSTFGTSFAAPMAARKLAFLIHIGKLSPIEAKALLIDSAAGWNPSPDPLFLRGHGVLPSDIRKITDTPEDEIRFIVSGAAAQRSTFNYLLPVPDNGHGRYPFKVRTTFCYVPKCDRDCGVDYVLDELTARFGIMGATDKNNPKVNNITGANRTKDDETPMTEQEAREELMKWDNVKRRVEKLSQGSKDRGKEKTNNHWGIEIVKSSRRGFAKTPREGNEPVRFALVVTLKEVTKANRITEFVRKCEAGNWVVRRLDIDAMLDLRARADADIVFED